MNKSITEGTQPDEHQSRVSEHETTRRINHQELIAAIEAMLFAPDDPVIRNLPDPIAELVQRQELQREQPEHGC